MSNTLIVLVHEPLDWTKQSIPPHLDSVGNVHVLNRDTDHSGGIWTFHASVVPPLMIVIEYNLFFAFVDVLIQERFCGINPSFRCKP